jgi:hypothetical protein
MTEEKIRKAAAALGILAGQVSDEQWTLVACVRKELFDAADHVGIYESCLSAELIGVGQAPEATHG